MTCTDCIKAEANPLWGGYSARCFDCRARSVAKSPAFFEATRTSLISKDFKASLVRTFPEGWEAGVKKAKEWAVKISTKGQI